MSNYNSFYSCH